MFEGAAMRGDRLKELREEQGLSQEELADQLGISEPQIWRYEKGDSAPRAEVLMKIATFFDVSADYLLGMTDNPGLYLTGELSTKERAVISAWRHGELLKAIKIISGE